ncbi:hypothetical protein [Cupriavidus sp. UYPR2.512]|uniref:hypothetical protein n=1 Tax=Cupriavidus sp. UYPR2.512 TaxID=1080187 RepID=UPI00350EDCA8
MPAWPTGPPCRETACCCWRATPCVSPRARTWPPADAVARRYGSQRWPLLLFFRGGQYVSAIAGMQDWMSTCKAWTPLCACLPRARPP